MDVRLLCLLCAVQVTASATHWSFVTGVLPGVCMSVIVCDLETSTMRRSRHEVGCCGTERKITWGRSSVSVFALEGPKRKLWSGQPVFGTSQIRRRISSHGIVSIKQIHQVIRLIYHTFLSEIHLTPTTVREAWEDKYYNEQFVRYLLRIQVLRGFII